MKKGFTLVELLAVIVIIAVISLITVPLLFRVIEESRMSAFKDSVMLSFKAAELLELNESIGEEGVLIKDLKLKNNNFKYGKIVENNNTLEAVNVSDGKYCASGFLTNITVYKGECDTNIPSSPTVDFSATYDTVKTYTVNPPSVMSGIEKYEYYLSETSTTPASDVIVSGYSSNNEIEINLESNYIFFRVVSLAGLNGLWSSANINYVDITNPNASLATTNITSNSLTLIGTCTDKAGITKYEFSKDSINYIDSNTTNIYTFNNIEIGNKTYYLRCTNGSGLKTTTSIEATTSSIIPPTYSITPSGYATSKVVTITYETGYINEYSLDSGTTWLTYTSPIVFNANGTVIARISDGTNYVNGSSYTVTNIDKTLPLVSTSVSGKVATLTLSDNLSLSGYTVTTSTVVPSTWTSITGTSSSQSYTGTVAGTYYAWVKDAAGNTAYSSFVLATTAFGAQITYITNGVTYVENIPAGSSALNPTSFTPTKSGATFLGWSSSLASTTPLTTKIVEGTPFTLYAIFKYTDISVPLALTQVTDGGGDVYSYHYARTWYSGIDMSRYVSLSVYVDTNMKTNWRGDSWNVQINAGGAAVQINNPGCDWSVPQVCYWTTYSSTRVLTFTASSGITNLITTLTSSVGGNGRGHIGMSNLVLYGRTVTG